MLTMNDPQVLAARELDELMQHIRASLKAAQHWLDFSNHEECLRAVAMAHNAGLRMEQVKKECAEKGWEITRHYGSHCVGGASVSAVGIK